MSEQKEWYQETYGDDYKIEPGDRVLIHAKGVIRIGTADTVDHDWLFAAGGGHVVDGGWSTVANIEMTDDDGRYWYWKRHSDHGYAIKLREGEGLEVTRGWQDIRRIPIVEALEELCDDLGCADDPIIDYLTSKEEETTPQQWYDAIEIEGELSLAMERPVSYYGTRGDGSFGYVFGSLGLMLQDRRKSNDATVINQGTLELRGLRNELYGQSTRTGEMVWIATMGEITGGEYGDEIITLWFQRYPDYDPNDDAADLSDAYRFELTPFEEFECCVSFTYNGSDPADAARQFLANIAANPNWFVAVRNTRTGDTWTVDTETGDIEEK